MIYPMEIIEFPITHACNLRCDGCTAYSNYGLKQHVTVDQAVEWMTKWSTRVKPDIIRILGGDPFIHKSLPAILLQARVNFPQSRIQIFTNGFNFDRHPGIEVFLKHLGVSISFSVHSTEQKYQETIQPYLEKVNEWAKQGIFVHIMDTHTHWTRFHQGTAPDILPFNDGDYKASFDACTSWHCITLLDGKLWKCPQIANLQKMREKLPILNEKEEWKPYFKYDGISPDCWDQDLEAFLKARAEPVCGMCPAKPVNYTKEVW